MFLAFLLQTVVYNIKKEGLAFNVCNPAIDGEKLAIRNEKPAIGDKKLAIEILESAIRRQNYNEKKKKNIITIYNAIETDQIFGAPEVKDILKCSVSASKEIMKKLRDIGAIQNVKGKGKGKYRFVNIEEMKGQV